MLHVCVIRRVPDPQYRSLHVSRFFLWSVGRSSLRAMSTSNTPRRLRILMLHGFTQSGPLFHAKTRALEKNLKKAFPAPTYDVEMVYPSGPIRVRPVDLPDSFSVKDAEGAEDSQNYAWWVRKGDGEPFRYEGIETGMERVAQTIRTQGPFDGVVGFSQGGAAAGMVASLLEPGRREAFAEAQKKGGMPYPTSFEEDSGYVEEAVQPQMRFAVSYSGFGATTNPLYTGFYEPKLKTPMLHFLGSVDTVVEEARSLRLVDACEGGRGVDGRRVVYHPGGHFLPSSQREYVAALVGFIKEAMGWDEGTKQNMDDKELDMPF